MSGVELFDFHGEQVRVIVGEDGEPWFIAADVARILGHREASSLTRSLESDEMGPRPVRTPSGEQEMLTISEPGLYSAIIQRQTGRITDPVAREQIRTFKRWVTHDVLPAIRKTGGFSVIPQQRQPESVALPGRRELALMVIEAEDAKALLEAQVAELEPAAAAWNELATAEGAYKVGDAAKMLCNAGIQTGQQRLFDYLGEIGWTFRGRGIDGRPKGPWHANQQRVNDKFLIEVPAVRAARDEGGSVVGVKVAPAQIQITIKGIEKLHGLMGRQRLALPAK